MQSVLLKKYFPVTNRITARVEAGSANSSQSDIIIKERVDLLSMDRFAS